MTTARAHSRLYDAYIRSRVWRLRRWWWYWTSDRRCESCGARLDLHRHGRHGLALTVHHRTYARLGHELRADVELLCWPCHAFKDAWRHPEAD